MPLSPTNSNKPGKPSAINASLSRSNVVASNLFSTKANNEAKILPIEKIIPDKQQPRRNFDEQKLQELAEDIKAHGILQPPIVRPIKANAIDSDEEGIERGSGNSGTIYQLVVGERRYRAALLAGLKEIPVIIREYNDEEAGVVSLVENLQREDLDIEDEALYFKRLTEEHQLSTRKIGKLINKNHLYVYKRLKLLERPDLLKRVRNAELNLNLALEIIREEADSPEDEQDRNVLTINSAVGSLKVTQEETDQSSRFPGKQFEKASSHRSANNFPAAWKKFYQFTSYLKQTIPQIEVKDDSEKEGLKQTIEEIETQLRELRKKLDS